MILGTVTNSINNSLENATGASSQPTVWEAVQPIIIFITSLVGIIAVIMIILGGIQYSTSQGASDKLKKAKDTILYGIIGLVISLLAFAIVGFVLDGVFQQQGVEEEEVTTGGSGG